MRTPVVLIALAGFWPPSCEDAATAAQIERMCEGFVALDGQFDMRTADVRAAKIRSDVDAGLGQLATERDQAFRALDQKLETGLAKQRNAAIRRKLRLDDAARRRLVQEGFLSGSAQVSAGRDAAIAQARKDVSRDLSEAAAAREDCLRLAGKEHLTGRVAECRIRAKTAGAYWECH